MMVNTRCRGAAMRDAAAGIGLQDASGTNAHDITSTTARTSLSVAPTCSPRNDDSLEDDSDNATTAPVLDSAATRTFKVPELLETILLQLPTLDLLLVQRVSTQFRVSIISSNQIQRALFFEPSSSILEGTAIEHRINPLIPKIYPGSALDYWLQERAGRGLGDSAVESMESTMLYKDQAFREKVWHWGYGEYRDIPLITSNVCLPTTEWFAHFGEEASWRRMYATHPATDINVCDRSSPAHVGVIRSAPLGEVMPRLLTPHDMAERAEWRKGFRETHLAIYEEKKREASASSRITNGNG